MPLTNIVAIAQPAGKLVTGVEVKELVCQFVERRNKVCSLSRRRNCTTG